MTRVELKQTAVDYRYGRIEYEQFETAVEAFEKALLQQASVSGSLHLVDFIEEIEYMQGLYSNARYTQAEATRDKLAEQLDDLMRLGQK